MEQLPVNPTLKEWIPLWMRAYKANMMLETSYHQLELLQRLIPEDLLSIPLADMRPLYLQSFLNQFCLQYSNSYINKMASMLHALFRDAMANGFCSQNPAQYLKVRRHPEREREHFTNEEVRAILNYVLFCDTSRMATAVLTLLLTGLRRGELLGLQWSDLTETTLSVNRSIHMEGGRPTFTEHRAKTPSSIRTIPLLPVVAHRLRALPKYGPFVFSARNGAIWTPRNFSRDYRTFFRRLQEADSSVRYLSPHCCRHTFATFTSNGASLFTLQKLMGHGDLRSTSRYTHPDLPMMQASVLQLWERLHAEL